MTNHLKLGSIHYHSSPNHETVSFAKTARLQQNLLKGWQTMLTLGFDFTLLTINWANVSPLELTEDMSLLGQKQRTLLLPAQQEAQTSALPEVLFAPKTREWCNMALMDGTSAVGLHLWILSFLNPPLS
jgi:hypothetical protein